MKGIAAYCSQKNLKTEKSRESSKKVKNPEGKG